MNDTKVTSWSIKTDKGLVEFNHVENGWSEKDAPTPNCKHQQTAWKNRTWVREHTYAVLADVTISLPGPDGKIRHTSMLVPSVRRITDHVHSAD